MSWLMSPDFILWQMKDVEQGDVEVTFKGRLTGRVHDIDWSENTAGDSKKREEMTAFGRETKLRYQRAPMVMPEG